MNLFINNALSDVLSVMLVHGGGDAICNQAMNSVSDLRIDLSNDGLFSGGEIAENIVDGIYPFGESFCSTFSWSNAYANPGEVLAFQMSDNRVDSFVTPRASTLSDAYLAQGEIEVVVDDNQVFGGEAPCLRAK